MSIKKVIPTPVMPTREQQQVWAERHLAPGRPFRTDVWPEALRERAGTLIEIEVTPPERDALITLWGAMADCLSSTPEIAQAEAVASGLADRIQASVDFWHNGAFVRLNTRSPKDNFEWLDDDGKLRPITSGQEAITVLTCSMERIYEDLEAAQLLGDRTQVFVVIRPFFTFEPWREVRIFIEHEEVVGISQYFYQTVHPEIIERASAWKAPLLAQVAQIMSEVPWSSFTLDGWMEDDGTFRFLEVNPPVSVGVTDPALFQDGKLDGSFRTRS